MSTSGRLVMHTRKLVILESISSSTSVKTFSRGDGIDDVVRHSSRASKSRYIGTCPGIFSISFKHLTSVLSPVAQPYRRS